MSYWQDRIAESNKRKADKTIEDIDVQLQRYYRQSMRRIIADFEATYDKLLATIEEGREPTPADLYKLDKYWQMQGQLKQELQKLGDKQAALLSKEFENEWNSVYNSIALPSQDAFSTISSGAAHSAINTVWLADGKTFSQRIWSNTEKLMETLNDNLTHCVITGKSTTELTKLLQDRFDVSYRQAKTLVKTEAAHIQVQAAAQRYQDYGLTEYEFLGRDEHDIGCNCKKLNGKVFKYSEAKVGVNMPPLHPNCRCDIIPVINNETIKD